MSHPMNGTLTVTSSSKDKLKDWQLEILMEKLRSKSTQFKSLVEISKNVRMSLLEKRYALDSVEKSQHQKCLDTLQHSIKVTCLQSMIERLESLTRQLGLRFVVESSGVFIFSDMFYLEIVLEPTGMVKDVKIHHDGKVEPQSCTELVTCLAAGNFSDFTAQLEGFVSIYQLNAEKKIKSKAFTALESLETDLNTLAQLQMFIKEPFNLIHKSPVGILEKRRGGHPMKLTYFVSPYDLINIERNDLDLINIENIITKELGYGVTVCMEGSAAHKLQVTTLITVNRNISGKNTPSYSPLTSQNSAVIPASFILKLNKPMPMCYSLIKQIQQIHPWTDIDGISPQPLLNLIVNHSSDGKLSCSGNKGLFVTLPDQNHCYFITENKNMNGIFVNSISFSHPAHVPNILMILREQALFNTLLSSCVRPNGRQDFENMTLFEVSALSSTQISISLEHPMEESMATADIDLSDISSLVCKVHNPGTPPPNNSPDSISELATKVLHKTFSIPITMRAVIKAWEKQATRRNIYMGHEHFNLPLVSIDPGGQKGLDGGSGLSDYGGLQDKIKPEPGGHGQMPGGHNSMLMQAHQSVWNESVLSSSNFQHTPPSDEMLTGLDFPNIMSSEKSPDMRQKRKAPEELWKSIRSKVGGNADDLELIESSSSDSASRSTSLSQETESAATQSGLQSDPELSNLDSIEMERIIDRSSDFQDKQRIEKTLSEGREENPRVQEKSPKNSVISTDIDDKHMGVSITPIPATTSETSKLTTANEINPMNSISFSNSISITPIAPSHQYPEERKEKKNVRSSKEDKSKLEKKRKKRREENPMGPPEKIPLKQDTAVLTKSFNVLSESTSLPNSTPSSPNTLRKMSPSPTSNSPLSSGKDSPSSKHSSTFMSGSPKHGLPRTSSPKCQSTSPKHSSGGKTLTDKGRALKEGFRDKDKSKPIFGVANSKTKPSHSPKVRALDLNVGDVDSSSSMSGDSKLNLNQLRNRKGTLSAIVDKLKVNAQNCDGLVDLNPKTAGNNKDRIASTKEGKNVLKAGEVKNSEYMVKPSSDGMKLTINKTRTKENKSALSGSNCVPSSNATVNSLNKVSPSNGSSKVHTGLKPGVTSGPASKKPQQLQKSFSANSVPAKTFNNSNLLGKSSLCNNSNVSNSAKSSAASDSLRTKFNGSTKTNSTNVGDLIKSKDRLKSGRSSSDKIFFSSFKERSKSCPISNESESNFKAQTKVDPYTSALVMEGMMKTFDKNFQIPKLSARTSEDKRKGDVSSYNKGTADTKIFEREPKNEIATSKYGLTVGSVDQRIQNNIHDMLAMSSKSDENGAKLFLPILSKFPGVTAESLNPKKAEENHIDFNKSQSFPRTHDNDSTTSTMSTSVRGAADDAVIMQDAKLNSERQSRELL